MDAGLEEQIVSGREGIEALLRAKRPLLGSAMLRPFVEAYEIVADVLRDAPAEISEKELTKLALGVGAQQVAQARSAATSRYRHYCSRPRGRWWPTRSCSVAPRTCPNGVAPSSPSCGTSSPIWTPSRPDPLPSSSSVSEQPDRQRTPEGDPHTLDR